jgi:uncharacterized protein
LSTRARHFSPDGLSPFRGEGIYMDVLPVILGSFAGIALGLVGGGGSILTVPLLVGILGVPAREATTMSLVVVGLAAAVSSIPHARRGNVLWGRALAFGAVGMAGTFVGAALNDTVSSRVLLAGFTVVMVLAAIATWQRAGRRAELRGDDTMPAAKQPSVNPVSVAAAALGVGVLTGFFGVGGGFLIVPALVLVLRLPMATAVGTSLVIIAINSASGLLAHLGAGAAMDPGLTALFTTGAIAGGLAGAAISIHLPSRALGRSFALVVLGLAAYLSLQVI